MTMPGRKYSATGEYRYGFNGKENDKDVSEGIQDYGMRIYDARIGKFLSVDPLTDEYPELTPYQYASNTPIQAIDIDGAEGGKKNIVTGEIIALGPVSNDEIKRIEQSGFWKVFFYPISRPKEQTKTSVSPKPPVYKPKIATGSDSFASDAVSNAAKINAPKKAKKQTTPVYKQATVSEYNDYKKSLSRLYERQYAYEKEMAERAALDPISYGGPGFGMGLARDPVVQNSALMVCPGCAVGIGGLTMYSGIQNGDNMQTAIGGLTIVGGAAGLSAKFASGTGNGGASLWPAASGGRTVINGIEYTTHALERMQPVGTIIKGTQMYSRGIPPSVVENAIKFGKITSGNSAAEVVRTFENVRVITNSEGTRVISVIKLGH